MNDFILNYWASILTVIIFIAVMVVLVRKGATKQVNQILFYLVIEAEKAFGGGTGKLKYSAVTTWLYERLPYILKILFTDKQIDQMIEKAVQDMKDYLENNKQAKVLIIK